MPKRLAIGMSDVSFVDMIFEGMLGLCFVGGGSFDFVHTYDFHRLSQLNGEGEPVLFVAKSRHGTVQACWPLLRRNIPNTGLFDLTSVYGYAGPVFSKNAAVDNCLTLLLSKCRRWVMFLSSLECILFSSVRLPMRKPGEAD